MKRIALSLLTISLLAGAPACSGTEAPQEEEGTSEEALTQTPAQRTARVAEILNTAGGLRMPPEGVRWAANEMTATAEVVPFAGSLRAMLQAQATPFLEDLGGNPAEGLLSFSEDPDTHLTVQFSYGDEGVREHLLDALVAPAKKRSIRAHLTKLTSTYARMSVYNAAAEIIGHEIVLIRPYDASDKVIVVKITYVHA